VTGTSLSDILNKHPYMLNVGDLVIVSEEALSRPGQELDNAFSVGVVLSRVFTEDEYRGVQSGGNFYYRRMYKIFICGKIYCIYELDIKERI
jgi:hypothetical protein